MRSQRDPDDIVDSAAIDASTELFLSDFSEKRGAALAALLAGFGLLMIGSGVQYPLIALRSADAGFGVVVIGAFTSAYYFGYVVGSMLTPRAIFRVGHIRLYAALAAIAVTAILVTGLYENAALWIILRFVSGICFAGIFVAVESWLIAESSPAGRGRTMSIYMVVDLAALAAAQFLINVPDSSGMLLFVIAAIAIALAIVPTTLGPSSGPVLMGTAAAKFRELWQTAPLAIVSCAIGGAGFGVVIGMAAIYAKDAGFSTLLTSFFLMAPIIGAIVSLFPIGHVSDHIERRVVIAGCGALCTAAAVVAALGGSSASPATLIVLVFVVGAASVPLYPLGVAHLADYIDDEKLTAATAKLVLVFGAGAAVGPVVASALMDYWTFDAFFWFLAVVHGAVCVYALYRIAVRQRAHARERREFVPIVSASTPQIGAMVGEIEEQLE